MTLKSQYNNLDSGIERLVLSMLTLFLSLGHKTAKCFSCQQETEIPALMKNVGYCSTCGTLKETEEANDNE